LRNNKKILLLRPSHQTQKKQFQMKKFFAILAVAGFLTACNDGGSSEEVKADSSTAAPAPVVTPDSSATATPDSSAVKPDSSAAKSTDTAAAKK
jgi:hypothetical protein